MCDLDAVDGNRRMSRRCALRVMGGAAALLATPGWPREAQPRGGPADEVEVAPGLLVRRRRAWAGDDRPPTGPLQAEDVRFLLVHHTATTNGYAPAEVPQLLRSVYAFHTGPQKRWPDVCYNFFISADGVVWEGRDGSLAGPVMADATGGSQGFAQLVCLLGDFTSTMPSDAALDSLVDVLAWLADRHGISTSPGATTEFVSRGSNLWPAGVPVVAATISGHRDMSQTACPGDTFYPFVREQVPRAVDARRASLVSPTTTTSTAPTTTSTTPTAATDPGVASTSRAPQTSPSTTATTNPRTPAPTSSVPATVPSAPDNDDEGNLRAVGIGAAVGIVAIGSVAAIVGRRSQHVRQPDHDPPEDPGSPPAGKD